MAEAADSATPGGQVVTRETLPDLSLTAGKHCKGQERIRVNSLKELKTVFAESAGG